MPELKKKVCSGKYGRIPREYSDELSSMISKCLQVYPHCRPSAQTLLESDQMRKRIMNKTEKVQDGLRLLGTIKLDNNLNALGKKLPSSN
jgi:pyruvate/oxaloacetate carboxyltransferase